ncbi:cupin domain-containing protein [Caulobacter sp. 17J65-9]|uniref:cupin domain-containing protein n=1 Tax=Caulobacter sp. 17J65-9 TaxID=2709382 RepID=UPI001969A98A
MALEALWFLNTRVEIRRPSADGADGVSIAEHRMPFGDSAPLHVHEREAEIFHLLEGEMRFRVGETETLARPGDTLVAPPGVPHTFRVESAKGARCLVITPGPDFEGLIRAAARPAEGPGLPPACAPTADQIEALGALALANRIELLGPPM